MPLEEDSRAVQQRPDNPANVAAGTVAYFTFNPPTRRPKITIRKDATATLAIKVNVPESESDPPTATDYHALLKQGHRNQYEIPSEPLVHTIAVLAIGAGATWGTHFSISGHHESSGRLSTSSAVPAVDYATPIGDYPFDVITNLPPAESVDFTGTITTPHGDTIPDDDDVVKRAKDLLVDIDTTEEQAWYAVGIYHAEDMEIDADDCKHGIRMASVNNALFHNFYIVSRTGTDGQSMKIVTNWNGGDTTSNVITQHWTTNNHILIGLVNNNEADYGQPTKIVFEDGIITAPASLPNYGMKMCADDVYLRDVLIDMTARHPSYAQGIAMYNGVAPSTKVCGTIYCTNVRVRVTQTQSEGPANSVAVTYSDGASGCIAAAPYDDIALEIVADP